MQIDHDRSKDQQQTPCSSPFSSKSDTAPAYWFVNCLWIILVDGKETGGRFSLIEQHMPKGSAPIPHVHNFTDEWFYILDGELEAVVADKTIVANKGDTLWIPRGTVHSFKVTSSVCRVLNGYEPAGVEQIIKGLSQPAERRELPPQSAKPDDKALTLLFNHYWACEADLPWAKGA